MITPTKGIAPDRALLAVGAQIAMQLDQPLTVSQAWSRVRTWRGENNHPAPISFGWFALALDMLFSLGLVDLHHDLLVRRPADAA
ncbi:ABC-three component system middle component 6 [Nocardia fluminea]|uniref:ABC-three component system middle component 6 n=1 Tax=Nocardia fluminea TaxID=134984 RepID=UPI003D099656